MLTSLLLLQIEGGFHQDQAALLNYFQNQEELIQVITSDMYVCVCHYLISAHMDFTKKNINGVYYLQYCRF